MVTKLKEDHQVVVGMNLVLTTKLDEDKALEIIRTKEKKHLAKLAMPNIETKGMSEEVIQQPQVLDMQAKHEELKPFASMPIPSQVKKRKPRRRKKNFKPSPTTLGFWVCNRLHEVWEDFGPILSST
ncbi:hypothetical protein QYF36_011397 [Acer negundo]|nr:hypothetical protein QYF36_011397 [Acer negundo]